MRRTFTYLAPLLLIGLFSIVTFAQTNVTLSGNVKGSQNNESISSASVVIKGTKAGTYTDERGNFRITTTRKFPLTLVFSSVGYATQEVIVSTSSQTISVNMEPVAVIGQEVTVSTSRLPERIMESPVTIDRISAAAIRNAPASSYYDIIGTLKGVDMTTSSLTFKTPSTRGFNTSGNLRLNQLVDGMDNQAPGLNFPIGGMIGPTELDVENIELLGGASSALYGPGGMNGTLLINSKNPFKYQGLSVQVKQGIMHMDERQRAMSPYYDYSFRWAKQLSEKFAFKIGAQYINAKDWLATDSSNYSQNAEPIKGSTVPGNRYSDPNYNGVNVYGDETSADLKSSLVGFAVGTQAVGVINLPGYGNAPIPTAAILNPYTSGASFAVSRSGYNEADIIDPTTKNLRVTGGLNYKFTGSLEGSLLVNWGSGSTVYTGSERYSFKDFKMSQYKAELKSTNWFVRAYTTQENAGETFNATVTTRLFNEGWKPSLTGWYPQFIQGLIQGSATAYGTALGQEYAAGLGKGLSPQQAYTAAAIVAANAVAPNSSAIINAARNFADQGRPEAGSPQFKRIFDSVRSKSISQGGGLFIDKSSLYLVEGQYNLSDKIKFAELLVGANFKKYVLNSQGTIFPDLDGIHIDEVGAYALASKRLFKDALKLTASGRYDKNQNFKGRFTPRFSAVVTVAKDHNIRASYQSAYRFPSTQNQWIDLVIGGGVRLIGGLPELKQKYNFDTKPVYAPANYLRTPYVFNEYKPESCTSYEIGYKGLINKRLLLDVYGYYSNYKNFIGRVTVLQASSIPTSPAIYSVSVNSSDKVNTQGWGASVEYLLQRNFSVNANLFSDEIKNVPSNFIAQYNTPRYRANIGISNSGFLYQKRVGFGIQYRYQGAVFYQADFGSGNISSYNTVDAQVNFKFPKIKSMIKIGGTNVFNHYYKTAFGNPEIGGLYYASIGYNIL